MSGADVQVRLTPGAAVFEDGADELYIALANHNVTFISREIIQVVRGLLEGLGPGATPTEAQAAAAAVTGAAPELCSHVWSLLENSGCLSPADAGGGDAGIWQFWQSQQLDVTQLQAQLAASPVLLASHEELLEEAVTAGELAGLTIRPVAVGADRPEEALAELGGGVGLLAVWGLHYASAQALALGEAALAAGVPALFGAAAGLIARIGPCVLPYASACLECTNLRLQSHAGPAEARVVAAMRAGPSVPMPVPPTHPLLRQAALGMFLIEASRICMNLPATTVSGMVELEFGVPASRRRRINRVPTCPACHPAQPQPFGWDVVFRQSVLREER